MHTATQWLHRAEVLLLPDVSEGDPTAEQVLECIRAALLKIEAPRPIPAHLVEGVSPDGERLLFVQTAVSQWLYGRMMDEDPCTSLLRIARTSADLWSYLTAPAAARIQPPSLWHQALYADALMIFGSHFK